MAAMATTSEVQAWLADEMDEADLRECTGALETLSDEARALGLSSWDETTVPGAIKRLVIKACVRYMKNYEGYVQSRAGDETLGWTDLGDKAGSPYFTDAEKASIRKDAGASTLQSVPVVAWGTGYPPEEFTREHWCRGNWNTRWPS